MTQKAAESEKFTGLILLTGIDRPGIAASLFEALAPFAIQVLDVEQIVINNRLILTLLIGANPAHQNAIEEDLNICATANEVDIATIFTNSIMTTAPVDLVRVSISADRLHPSSIAQVANVITSLGGNIQQILRSTTDPVNLNLTVSGLEKGNLKDGFEALQFEHPASVSVID
jgi:phosphoserine phosphatase